MKPEPSKIIFSLLILQILALCIFAGKDSHAQISQEIQDQGSRISDQILRQQQRFIEEEEIRLQKDRLQRESGKINIKTKLPKEFTGLDQGFCMEVKRINFEGVSSLYKRDKREITKNYIGKCLKIDQIFKLLNDVNSYYIKKGMIAARSYIAPDQSIKDEVLTIIVQEGIIEDIRINDNKIKNRLERSTAFPMLKGAPLNIKDLEQGLDQMNRLRSNKATLDIEASKDKAGHSIVNINNKTNIRTKGFAGFDNKCSDSTGRNCYRLNLEQDNLFSLNDQIYLSLSEYAGSRKNQKNSSSAYLSFSIPFGYWTGQVSFNDARYHSTIDGGVQSFINSGYNKNYGASLERLVWRDQDHKTTIKFALNHKFSESFIRSTTLTNNTRKLTIAKLGLSHYMKNDRGFNLLNLDYLQGTKLFDAKEDSAGQAGNVPRAQYEALRVYFNNYRYFRLAKQSLTNSLTFSGQYSRHTLFGSEQFSAGDPYSVRGFRNGAISGDHGFFLKNDLSWRLPTSKNKITNYALRNSHAFIGLDFGAAKSRVVNNSGPKTAQISGATLGLRKRVQIGKVAFDGSISYSRAISASDSLLKDDNEIYFNLGIRNL